MSLNCVDATRLLSDSLDRPLHVAESAGLEEHLRGCPSCVECGRQFELLRAIVRAWRERAHAKTAPDPP